MGTLVGHVAPGLGFFLIGLWHLLNHIKLHATNPTTYLSLPWFPSSRLTKYLELYLIIAGCCASISMELFISPDHHQPFDPDGTIPSNHLHNFEHSFIALTLLTYAAFAILLDKLLLVGSTAHKHGMTQLLAAVAFAQELLLFRLHSTDHVGMEGQYHLLLQAVVAVCLSTTLLGIALPRSFLISFVRSASIMFQGAWLAVMGYMLWTPGLLPKGCFLHLEEGHDVARCGSDEALHRAKSLINIGFAWALVLVTVFSVCLYLLLLRVYGNGGVVEYQSLSSSMPSNKVVLAADEEKLDEDLLNDDDDVESQKRKGSDKLRGAEVKSFINVGGNSRAFAPMDMER